MSDEGRINPEEEPEAALEELAEGRGPETPARRRRLARAALTAVRDARRSARIGLGLGAVALLVALGVAVLALTRDEEDGGGARTGGAGAITDDIVAEARPGTIYVESEGFGQRAAGTGVLVDADEGLVLTNFHVVSLGDDLQAGTPDRLDDAEIVAAAPCEDLALLEVEGLDDRSAIALGEQDDVAQGDPVVALGYPVSASGGKSLTSTAGVVSSVNTPLRLPAPDQPRFQNLVQTDAALGAGNSGGPLVGADGRLVGVNTILFTGSAGSPSAEQGYAIGVDRVREVLADFRDGRSRAWFGAGPAHAAAGDPPAPAAAAGNAGHRRAGGHERGRAAARAGADHRDRRSGREVVARELLQRRRGRRERRRARRDRDRRAEPPRADGPGRARLSAGSAVLRS